MMERAGCIGAKINEGLCACFWMAISVQEEVGPVVEDGGRGIGSEPRCNVRAQGVQGGSYHVEPADPPPPSR